MHEPFLFKITVEVFLESESAINEKSIMAFGVNLKTDTNVVLECKAFLVDSLGNHFGYKTMLVYKAKIIVGHYREIE